MRRLLPFFFALAVALGGAASAFGQGFNGGCFNCGCPACAGGASYQGPGDVASGATAWWGLRGYNAAYSTGANPAVDITDQALANPLTVNILSNGKLDVPTITAWVTAHSVTAIKIAKL